MDKIKFYVKSSYGKERAYLLDDDKSKAWRRLSGRLTLTPSDLKDLASFGVKVEKVESPDQKDF